MKMEPFESNVDIALRTLAMTFAIAMLVFGAVLLAIVLTKMSLALVLVITFFVVWGVLYTCGCASRSVEKNGE